VACSEQAPSQPPALAPPTPEVRPRKPPRRKEATVSQQRRWQLEMYQQVRELVAQDWTKRAIAQHLHLHPHTVGK
jgi:hypothetical protein